MASARKNQAKTRNTVAKVKAPQKAASKPWSWGQLLGKAASTALDLAPALLPLLLGKHGPSMSALASAGGMAGIAASGAPVAGLAQSVTVGNLTGIKALRSGGADAHGNVNTLTATTMDLVAPLGTAAYSAGDIMFEVWLSPLDPAFEGTKFATFGGMYSKYRVKKVSLIYEPTCPATTAGAVAACIFADPLTDVESTGGLDLLRVVGSEPGSDTFNVWSAGVVGGPASNLLFTDPNGSDARVVVAGKICVVAASDIAGGVELGNLFLAIEVEYQIPTIVDQVFAGAAGYFAIDNSSTSGASAQSNFAPIAPTDVLTDDNNFMSSGAYFDQNIAFSDLGGVAHVGNALVDLTPGTWNIQFFAEGTALGSLGCTLTQEAFDSGCYFVTEYTGANAMSVFTTTAGFISIGVVIVEGLPKHLPMICFSYTSTAAYAIGDVRIIASKLHAETFSGLYPMPALSFRGAGPSLMTPARWSVFRGTQQCRQAITDRKIASLADAVTRMTAASAASAMPISSSLTTSAAALRIKRV